MKKIFFSIVALAALAACSKSEVAYEQPTEIGFKAVAGNATKAIVPNGDAFPTGINLFIFAETEDNSGAEDGYLAPNYINNGEFQYKNKYGQISNPTSEDQTAVWGGIQPYYWPNVKKLHFAGYSKSGNFISGTAPTEVKYNCEGDVLSIKGYTPGDATDKGANDLMWFASTKNTGHAGGYGKEDTDYVNVTLAHTCSWITFIVKGDAVTSGNYTVKSINIAGIDATADVVCSSTADPEIQWSNNENVKTAGFPVAFKTANGFTLNTTGTNPETDDATTTTGNIVLIPQVPGSLELTYSYLSTTNAEITEEYSINKGNAPSLALDADPVLNVWEPGKHYIYTVTIKANEILIAPAAGNWVDANHGVTVE